MRVNNSVKPRCDGGLWSEVVDAMDRVEVSCQDRRKGRRRDEGWGGMQRSRVRWMEGGIVAIRGRQAVGDVVHECVWVGECKGRREKEKGECL